MKHIVIITIMVLSVSACTDFTWSFKPSLFSEKKYTTPFTPYEEAVQRYNRQNIAQPSNGLHL